ncbi:MAG: hypothetical protein KC912_09870 [Proteobacteria bacterium]|nr:hypothetical protein [Pseudomonadota bacterium]
MRILILPFLVLAACNIELPDERNCDDRLAYYPDEDGDGIGEPTDVYIGCEAPEGWVDNVDTAMPYVGARRRAQPSGWRLPPGSSSR